MRANMGTHTCVEHTPDRKHSRGCDTKDLSGLESRALEEEEEDGAGTMWNPTDGGGARPAFNELDGNTSKNYEV